MKRSVIIILHFAYWLLYFLFLAMLTLVFSLKDIESGHRVNVLGYAVFWLSFAIMPGAVCFYSFYTFLFSTFLKQKKIALFFLSGILTALLCGILGAIFISILHMFGISPGLFVNGFNSAIPITLFISFNALLNGILGLGIKGFISWYNDIKLKEELNKKNYEAELALIKAQINPHFLFNTINNIDILITKDAAKASDYLNKLSDIMRFTLYETGNEKIQLEKELEYIQKYIELQKIRTQNPDYVRYGVTGDFRNLQIAPMLFIPFIENAFKHSENKKSDSTVNISFTIEKNKIIFECENCYGKTSVLKEDSGLGNELIKRRLKLLYHEKHSLEITDENSNYKVRLTVNDN